MTGSHSVRTMIGVALVSGLVSVLITSLFLGWWADKPAPQAVTPGTHQAAPLPPAVTTPPSIEIPDTKTPTRPAMRAIPKTPEVRKRTKLPPAMLDGDDTFLLATGHLAAEKRDYTITSTLDRRTGETQVHAVADPLPWLARASEYEIAVGYTIKHGIEAKARADMIRSKSLYGYAEARANQDEADIGIYIGARF